jgi:arylsulfatase A-like enzyme
MRPNIVLITSDQHRADCLGVYGRKVKTPHIDEIAAAGALFDNCITPSLVCQPARASILTGLLPRTHGVCDNGIDLNAAIGERGLAGAMTAARYTTGFIGKAHFSTNLTFAPTGTPECQHSQQNFGPKWTGPYMGFEHVELVVEGHNTWLPLPPPKGQHHSRWFYSDGNGDNRNIQYQSDLGPASIAPQTFYSGLPVAWHNSTWVGDRTIDFISKQKETPFFVWASFPDPHHPFDCPEPWSRLHRDDEVDLPAHRTLDLDRRPWWHRASLESEPVGSEEIRKIRKGVSRMNTLSDNQLRRVTSNYFGMISLIDHQVGRIKTLLSNLNLLNNTIIIFASDHGEYLGDHGLMLKGPMAYEGLLRVPLVMQGKGIPSGVRISQPVSTLDLADTILDFTGTFALSAMHGRSLRPILDGEARDFALSEWDVDPARCGVELRLRTVRTREAKLTLELSSGSGELYDLSNDPNELINRFDDSAYRNIKLRLIDMINSRPSDEIARAPASGVA